MQRSPSKIHWQSLGAEPDYRFSLANERTFLAWIRTALALLAGAMLVHQFATGLEPRWLTLVFSLALAVVSALLSVGAFLHWKGNEIAMRNAGALPRSYLLPFMAGVSIAVSLAVAVILGLQ